MYKLLLVFLLVISCHETKVKDFSKKNINPIDYNAYNSDYKPNIDSLFQAISLRPDDTLKVNDLLTIFRLSIKNKPIREDALEAALQVSRIINYETGIANCLNRKGVNARYQHEYLKSTKFHKEAIEHYKKSWDIASYVKNLNSLGVSYRKMNLEEEALKYYYQALELSENLEDTKSIAIALNGIGNAFINLEKYDDAKKYFELALNLEELNNNSRGMGYDYSNLGEVYMFKKQYDSSYAYHMKSLKIAEKLGYKDNVAIIYNTIGIMFQHKGEYETSLEYLNKALPVLTEFRSKRYLSNTLTNIGIDQVHLKYHDKAEINIIEGLRIAKGISSRENIILSYKALSDLYNNSGHFKQALDAYEMMTIYKDSMFNFQSKNHIAAMQIKYDSEKKDERIKQLHLKNEIQKSGLITQFLAIGLLLLLIIFFFFYNRLRLKNKSLEIKAMRHKIEIYLQQISKLENSGNFNEKAKDYGLSSRETEVLNYIAKGLKNQEIADTMFVSLSTVKTHTKNIFEKLEVRNRIEAAQKAQVL